MAASCVCHGVCLLPVRAKARVMLVMHVCLVIYIGISTLCCVYCVWSLLFAFVDSLVVGGALFY